MSVDSKYFLRNNVDWDAEMPKDQKERIVETFAPILDAYHKMMVGKMLVYKKKKPKR